MSQDGPFEFTDVSRPCLLYFRLALRKDAYRKTCRWCCAVHTNTGPEGLVKALRGKPPPSLQVDAAITRPADATERHGEMFTSES